MFPFCSIQNFLFIIFFLLHPSQQHDHENERFLPTFTSIEPDVHLRRSVITGKLANGTEESDHGHIRHLKPSKSFATNDGRKLKVFDNVLDFKLLNSLHDYSQMVADYEFHNNKDASASGAGPSPWHASFDPKTFESSAVLAIMKELLTTMEDDTQTPFLPYSISGHVLRRGDHIPLTKDNNGREKELSLLLYFNHFWRKNDYGELLFYEDDNDSYDSFAAVSPKYNRMVIWDSTIGYILKPPSMDFKQGMICLKVQFTTNATKQMESMQQARQHYAEKMRARETLFTEMKGSDVTTIEDVENCLTKNFTTSEGKRLYVFDGLFNHDDLMKLRDFVPRHGNFFFDDSLDLDSDNVQWIAGFPIDDYVKSPMWPATQKVATFVSGTDQWYPYDVSCNLLRTYDHTRIHEDCEVLEKEWTFLVYLTDDWSEDKYGETTFLHFHAHESEHVISVLPRFGRVVIFDGIIPHSARPPSPTFKDARLTFVAKLSINEWVARVKSLKSEFGHEEGMHQQCLGLFRNYYDANYEEDYRQMLLENAQELREVNDALTMRYQTAYSGRRQEELDDDGDEDDDDAEDEDEREQGHHNYGVLDGEYAEYDEPSHFEGELYQDVQKRKNYIYSLLSDQRRDVGRLRDHYAQFLVDVKEIKERYQEQMQKLI